MDVFIIISTLLSILCCFVPQGMCCPAFPQPIGNMTPDYDLLVGSELILNCSLHKNFIKNSQDNMIYINSSSLVFKFGGNDIAENVKIVDDLTIQLTIPNATVNHSGKYFCFLNVPQESRKLVCNGAVAVGYKSLGVENFTCHSFYLEKLRCTWMPPPNPVKTEYTLSEDIFSSNKCYPKPFIPRNCPAHTKNSCEWTLSTDPQYRINREKLCLFLHGNNSLGTSDQRFIIDHYSIVLPGKPKKLIIQNNTANSFMAFWLPPNHMGTKEEFPPGLTYEVKYKPKYSNLWQVRKLDNETHVNITNLIPHTDYELQLRCRSRSATTDEMWSEAVNTSVHTYSDIPYLAPEITLGLFETRHLGLHRNITLHWKGIPKQFWNGDYFKYIISYYETHLRREKRTVNQRILNSEETSAVFIGMDINTAYEFVLSSANDKGKSHNFSKITVQKKEDMPHTPREIKVIYHEGHYNLSWERSNGGRDPIDSYTIFWCRMLQPGLFPCNGPLNWKSVSAAVRKVSLFLPNKDAYFQFAVSANTKYSSSGLEWAPCVIPSDGVLNKINTVILQALSSTSLNVIWNLDCPVHKHLVQEYKISYCRVKNYNETCLVLSPHGIIPLLGSVFDVIFGKVFQLDYLLDPKEQPEKLGEVHPGSDLELYEDKLKNVTVVDKQADNYTLKELEPFSLYRVVVFAITKTGSSEESIPQFAKTKSGAPSVPQHFLITNKTDTTIEARWDPPLKPNGNVDQYKINIMKDGYDIQKPAKVYPSRQKLTAKFEQLTPYTNYTLELVACVDHECSDPSLINTITKIGVPGPMEGPIPEVHNGTFVQVSWIPPSEPNGPVDFYTLYTQWEDEDELHTNAINVTGASYQSVTVTCPVDDKGMLYFFSIQAANIRDKEVLYGNRSNAVQSRLCFSNKGMELGVIIGITVGGAAILACVIITIYFFARWMKKKVDTIKDIKVQLPLGLETPQGVSVLKLHDASEIYDDVNPLNSYENFKNGLVRKPSDSNLSPKTFYGRLNSYASDESDPKDRNDSGTAPFGNNSQEALIHKMKDHSEGKNNNGNTNIGKGHDSISSSLTTRTQLSSDSGAETDVQAPPSPESDNVPLGLPHTSPQPNKSSLPKVNEGHSCDSKDSGLEKEEGGSEKESDASDPNQYTKFVRYLDNPNHPYNRRQVSDKGTTVQQLPYSKFGVNMPGISGYVPLSSTLALMPRSLANSEPSVVDAETVNKSNQDIKDAAILPAPPYSKYGIGRSLGQSLNVSPSNGSDSLGTGYSKCGIGPDISWLQQPRSPYIAANLASMLLGNDTTKDSKQLNPNANNIDLTGHLKNNISPLPLSPSHSSPRSKGYVTVDNMNKPSSFSPNQHTNGPAYSGLEENKVPRSKGYVSVQDAKNMLSEDRKLPQFSETKDQAAGIPGYSKFDIQCDRLQNTSDIQTLDPVLTGTKPKTYPGNVHQGYVPYHNPAFSSVNIPNSGNDHTVNGNLNGDLSSLSTDLSLECENSKYDLGADNHSPSKYFPQSKACKPASELSNGYVTVNADSTIDAIRIVPTDSQLCPSLTDTAV